MNISKQLFVIFLVASSLAGNLFGAKPGRTTYGETKRSESETNATTAASSASTTPATPAVAAPTGAPTSSIATSASSAPQAPLLLTYVPDAPEAIRLPYTPTIPEPLTPEIFGNIDLAPLPKKGTRPGWGTTTPPALFDEIFSYLPLVYSDGHPDAVAIPNPQSIKALFRTRRTCKLFYEQLRGQKIINLIRQLGPQIPRSINSCTQTIAQASLDNRHQVVRVILFAASQNPCLAFINRILTVLDGHGRNILTLIDHHGHDDIARFIIDILDNDPHEIIESIIQTIKSNPALITPENASFIENKLRAFFNDLRSASFRNTWYTMMITQNFFHDHIIEKIGDTLWRCSPTMLENIIQALESHPTSNYTRASLVAKLRARIAGPAAALAWVLPPVPVAGAPVAAAPVALAAVAPVVGVPVAPVVPAPAAPAGH